LLWTVLAVNASFFALEALAGFLAGSMGLLADSLDMLADALVYGLTLLAIGSTMRRKKRVAAVSGYLQLGLALLEWQILASQGYVIVAANPRGAQGAAKPSRLRFGANGAVKTPRTCSARWTTPSVKASRTRNV
jgi:hypothetical protein